MVGAVLMLASAVIAGWQCVVWLRDAQWPRVPVRELFVWAGATLPTTSFQGVQEIIDWLLDCPLSVTLLVVGMLVAFSHTSRQG